MKDWKGNATLLLQGGLGILISRVTLFQLNPLAIAIFAATYREKKKGLFLFLCVGLGIITSMPVIDASKYLIVMVLIVTIERIFKSQGKQLKALGLSIIGAASTFILDASAVALAGFDMKIVLLSILEVVIIVALTNLFACSIYYINYARRGQQLSNEQLISLVTIITFAIVGLPALPIQQFSVVGTLCYLFVLFMGYKYGAGAGAVAGTAIGISQALGGDYTQISIFCILGMVAGMMRELARIGDRKSVV